MKVKTIKTVTAVVLVLVLLGIAGFLMHNMQFIQKMHGF
jgi:hypothetical protein